MTFQIKARKQEYSGELVKGQNPSVKIVPSPADGERLHEHFSWALDNRKLLPSKLHRS